MVHNHCQQRAVERVAEEPEVSVLRRRGQQWALFLNSLFGSHPFYWLLGKGGSVAQGHVGGYGFFASDEPHNDFIRILHAYGFLGLSAYLLSLLGFFVQSIWLMRKATKSFLRDVAQIFSLDLVGVVLLSITTEPMRYPTAGWYLFAFASVVAVRNRMVAEPGERF